jgi:hypothetical protein
VLIGTLQSLRPRTGRGRDPGLPGAMTHTLAAK